MQFREKPLCSAGACCKVINMPKLDFSKTKNAWVFFQLTQNNSWKKSQYKSWFRFENKWIYYLQFDLASIWSHHHLHVIILWLFLHLYLLQGIDIFYYFWWLANTLVPDICQTISFVHLQELQMYFETHGSIWKTYFM